jgi:ABC-type sulfate transport system permease component
VLYLAIPIGSFALRFVVGPARGFHTAGLLSSLWVSVCCATITLALVTVFGVPLAFVLARSKGRFASVVGLVVMIPLALPPLMSGLLLVYVVGPYTFLGRLFGGRLTDSMVGIVIAMTFCSAPFLIIAVRAAFESIDQGQLDVAATLGHTDVSKFVRVAVPMAGPSVRAGMLLTWLRAFGEYGAVIVLAYNPASLPVYTYNQFSGRGLPTTLAPTALALVVAVVVVMVSRVRVTAPARPITAPALETPTPQASYPVRFDVDHYVGTSRWPWTRASATSRSWDRRARASQRCCGASQASTVQSPGRFGTATSQYRTWRSNNDALATSRRGLLCSLTSLCGATCSSPKARHRGWRRTGSSVYAWTGWKSDTRPNFLAVSVSGWRWPKRSASHRGCSCSMSRFPHSICRCAGSCAVSFARSNARPVSRQ